MVSFAHTSTLRACPRRAQHQGARKSLFAWLQTCRSHFGAADLVSLPLPLSISIIVIIYLLGIITHFHISKKREYRADIFAAQIFGKDNAINTLSKLKKSSLVPEKAFSLFEVHPKLELRIKYVKEKVNE
ncbi:M48 family metalloprotease [Bacillus swezeyi]|uniref:M48 family metalloprotease n=1 Tax=Bacillus swezeyi TaxID=1925020 RepID=UPI0039C7449D